MKKHVLHFEFYCTISYPETIFRPIKNVIAGLKQLDSTLSLPHSLGIYVLITKGN